MAVHSALEHLEGRYTYVRMLFVDYSSAFNTIIPTKLIAKMKDLGLNSHLCNWVLDFLTGRWLELAIIHPPHSHSTLVLHRGCVLSPLLYSLFTYDCSAKHS